MAKHIPKQRGSKRPGPKRRDRAQGSITRLPSVSTHEINTALADAQDEVWDLGRIHAFVASNVEDILDRRAVPRRFVQRPNLDIAVPAIEAMRYCRFRSEMAAMIAAAMDARLAHKAHPAFIDILRQLTRDEVAMLKSLPGPDQVTPLGHIHRLSKGGRTELVYRSVVPAYLAECCLAKDSIPTYVDNLARLNLIAIPKNLTIQEDLPYQDLVRQSFCRALRDRAPKSGRIRLERCVLVVTDLGESFRQVCLT